MSRKVLVVTKDIGGFKSAEPLAVALANSGCPINIIAEGKSVKLWEEARWSTKLVRIIDSQNEDIVKKITELAPDVIVVTLGDPINLENKFANAANKLGIPLVFLPDIWGAETRSSANPDLVLALDTYDASLSKKMFPNAHMEVVGYPFISGLVSETISRKVIDEVDELRKEYDGLVLLEGEGAYPDVIKMLRLSLKLDDKKYLVIPKLHPKLDRSIYTDIWLPELKKFPNGTVLEDCAVGADNLAALCDITFATFTLLLVVSAFYNRVPISAATRASQEHLLESTGLEHYPPVEAGVAVGIHEPTPLSTLLTAKERAKMEGRQKKFFRPFNSQKAIKAMEELILQNKN